MSHYICIKLMAYIQQLLLYLNTANLTEWLLSLKKPVTSFLDWISKAVLFNSAGIADEWNQAVEVKTNLIIHANNIHNKNILLKPTIYIVQDIEAVSEE